MTRRLPIALALGVTLAGLALLGAGAAGLRVNATASMPRGLWRVAPAAGPIPRGAIVSLCLPQGPLLRLALRRGYLGAGPCPGGAEPFLKPVVAIAGDAVRVTPAGIAVNGALLPNSAARQEDTAGRPAPIGSHPARCGWCPPMPSDPSTAGILARCRFRPCVAPPGRYGSFRDRRGSPGVRLEHRAGDP